MVVLELRVFHEDTVGSSAWAAISSNGSTGAAGSTFRMSPSHGCWWEASVPHCKGQSIGYPLTAWQLASPRVNDPSETQVEAKSPKSQSHFHLFCLLEANLYSGGDELTTISLKKDF